MDFYIFIYKKICIYLFIYLYIKNDTLSFWNPLEGYIEP